MATPRPDAPTSDLQRQLLLLTGARVAVITVLLGTSFVLALGEGGLFGVGRMLYGVVAATYLGSLLCAIALQWGVPATPLAYVQLVGDLLLGVVVLGVGPTNVHRLFNDARRSEVACLARLWLDDRLGRNSESRVLGVVLRLLRKEQSTLKALVAYSDPTVGHTGMIYRAAGLLYLGESMAMPL